MSVAQSQPETPALTGKAVGTVQRVREGLKGGDVSFAQVAQTISKLSRKTELVSIQELAEFINQDLAIVSKVLAAANTIAFNPWGIEVNSINDAIQVVGLGKIRDLAVALILFEKAEGRLGSAEHRETASLALASGLFAQEFAGIVDPSIAEQAFVCAALRNYGRLLLSVFLAEDFREARALAARMDGDDAYRDVFGLTPLELSHLLLQSNNLPESIMRTLRDVPPEMLRVAATEPDERLLLLADFSVKLCEALDRPGTLPLDKRLSPLLSGFSRALGVTRSDVVAALEQVNEKLCALGSVSGVDGFESRLTRRIAQLAKGEDPYELERAAEEQELRKREAEVKAQKPAPKAPEPAPKPGGDPAAYGKASQRLSLILGSGSASVNEALQVVATAMRDGLGLDQVVTFLRSPSGRYAPCGGAGDLSGTLASEGAQLVATARDVFSVPLQRGEDVMIQDAGTAQLRPFLPGWLRDRVVQRGLILLACRHNGQVYALLCGLSHPSRGAVLNAQDTQQLRVLRASCAAIRELEG